MTRDRNRKRRVRDRAAKTGESYTAALRHLRNQPENPMETTTTLTCLLCGTSEQPLYTFRTAPVCVPCDAEVRSVMRRHLEPVAHERGHDVDRLMSAIVYERTAEAAKIHLLSLSPGLVIGKRAATVGPLKEDLDPLAKLGALHLNIRPLIEKPKDPEPAADEA